MGDLDSRQFLADLRALANARSNVEFTDKQQEIVLRRAPASSSEKLAAMTAEQIQKFANDYHHAYQLVNEALPWLTERMGRLLGRLKEGRIEEARSELARELQARYAETSVAAQDEVGRDNAVEHYTTGGAPINVGKYRACVGCDCPNPCSGGTCPTCSSCGCETKN